MASPPQATVSSITAAQRDRPLRKTRNQKACDLCRARRVKCRFPQPVNGSEDEPGTLSSCERCLALGVPCTSNRPRRKRGPPNTHIVRVQAGWLPLVETHNIQRDRPDHPPVQSADATIQPPCGNGPPSSQSTWQSQVQALQDIPCLPQESGITTQDSLLRHLGPMPLIRRILDDWFEHVHPLAPILYRREFLQRLNSGEADTNPIFCALVISVISATCATLRSKSYTDYCGITPAQCIRLVEDKRLLEQHGPYSLDWCSAYYNLAASSVAVSDMPPAQARRYYTDAQMGVKSLLHHESTPERSFITEQLLKRLYWLLVVAELSHDLVGWLVLGFVSIHDHTDRSRRPLPLSDDQLDARADVQNAATTTAFSPAIASCSPTNPLEHQYSSPATDPRSSSTAAEASLSAWHGDSITYVPALNHLADIFLAWHRAHIDRVYLGPDRALANGLNRVQNTLDHLPPELRWRGGLSRPRGATLGHDAQIANLFITSLYIRSNLLQLFGSSSRDEHQRLVSDLLEILHHLPRSTLEANGLSLLPKIRDIGGAYLSELSDDNQQSIITIDENARDKLQELLGELEILDFTPGR